MFSELLQNFKKPQGLLGGLIVRLMNRGHAVMTREVLAMLPIRAGDTALDIGCGGGMAVARMAERGAKVIGLDYSQVSVDKASQHNREAITHGRVTIMQGDANNLEFPEASFDWVTAFETLYFWTAVEDSFKAIHTILRPGGHFVVALEAYPRTDKPPYPRIFSGLQLRLFTPEELQTLARNAGFAESRVTIEPASKCLTMIASKAA